MRKIKVSLSLAIAAMLAMAVAIPAVASAANWTEEGVALTESVGSSELRWSQQNEPLGAEATATFAGSFNNSGGVECSSASGKLTFAPASTGGVSEFAIVPGSCKAIGGYAALGCKTASSVTANSLPWSAKPVEASGKRAIQIENMSITYQLQGIGLCSSGLKTTLTGAITATPDSNGAISNLTLSGLMKASTGTNVTISGALAVSPAGKYGIIDTGTGISLTEGTLSFAGGTQCPISGTVTLQPGSNGRLTAISWGDCAVVGGYAGLGCTEVASSVPTNLPWPIKNEETTIKISEVDYTMVLKGGGLCAAGVTLKLKGSLTATPDDASKISHINLSGTLSSPYTNYSVLGAANWNPAGQYGL